jgi:hypothetical protein
MLRFTIRELVLITVIVALGLGWLLSWGQWRSTLSDARRVVAEERANAEAWEGRAMHLVKQMRQAGWGVEVTRGTASMQWPAPDAYQAIVEQKRERAGLNAAPEHP